MGPEQANLITFKQAVLFAYSTKRFLKKDKIRFFYALNGRPGKTGFLKECDADHFGVSVILVPSRFDKKFQLFFKKWGIPFKRTELLIEPKGGY